MLLSFYPLHWLQATALCVQVLPFLHSKHAEPPHPALLMDPRAPSHVYELKEKIKALEESCVTERA